MSFPPTVRSVDWGKYDAFPCAAGTETRSVVTSATQTIPLGTTQQFTATGTYTDGSCTKRVATRKFQIALTVAMIETSFGTLLMAAVGA